MDELRNEVTDDGADNPMRPYKIQFPYQVKFNLAADDNHTEVISVERPVLSCREGV
jgi:hypothetical protein